MSPARNDICTVADCERDTHKAGLCRAHYARRARGRPLEAPVRQYAEPARTLMEAAFAFADAAAEDDEAYHRAWARLWMAAQRVKRGKHRAA